MVEKNIESFNSFIIYIKYFNANITQKQYRFEIIKTMIKNYNMKVRRIDNKFSIFQNPVKELKFGICKNCSFTKVIKLSNHQQVNICVM